MSSRFWDGVKKLLFLWGEKWMKGQWLVIREADYGNTMHWIFKFPFIIIYQDWISKKDSAQKRHLIHHIQQTFHFKKLQVTEWNTCKIYYTLMSFSSS
jgi:hypothetical protein